MKTIKFIALSILLMAAASCNTPTADKNANNHEHDGHEHTYACPMHPEVTGHQGDKCTKCGMPLEEIKEKVANNTYVMQFTSSPATIESGKETNLIFTPQIENNATALVPLDVVHEKKIHLIVVSEDLSFFDHIHPEYNADGSYSVNEKFPSGGNYYAFADFQPSGGQHTVSKIPLAVLGAAKPAVTYNKEIIKYVAPDGIGIELKADNGKFESGIPIHFDAVLTDNGKLIDAHNLDNYLGAKGHMVAIDVVNKNYMHVHPEVENTILHNHATLPSAGTYRMWLQFQYKGKLYTADFVINATPGDPNAPQEAASEHHH
jgi:hypothetical protein